MVVKVFITSVSANAALKKNQQTVIDTLEAKNIQFEAIDIASPDNEEQKQFMREHAKPKDGQTTPMPPQIFVDDEYVGDYDAFYEATENNSLDEFFKLAPQTQSSEATLEIKKPQEPISGEGQSVEGETHNANPEENNEQSIVPKETTESAENAPQQQEVTTAEDMETQPEPITKSAAAENVSEAAEDTTSLGEQKESEE